jgi:hypothetical protein
MLWMFKKNLNWPKMSIQIQHMCGFFFHPQDDASGHLKNDGYLSFLQHHEHGPRLRACSTVTGMVRKRGARSA